MFSSKQKKAHLKSVSSIRCTKQEFTQKLYVNTSVTNKIGWKPSNTPYSATTSRCSYVSHTITAQSFVIFTCPFTHAFIIVLFGRLSNSILVGLIVASTFSHIMMKRNYLCSYIIVPFVLPNVYYKSLSLTDTTSAYHNPYHYAYIVRNNNNYSPTQIQSIN